MATAPERKTWGHSAWDWMPIICLAMALSFVFVVWRGDSIWDSILGGVRQLGEAWRG